MTATADTPSLTGDNTLVEKKATWTATGAEEASSDLTGHEDERQLDNQEYPAGARLWWINIALYFGGFLIALDGTALGAAVPVITNEFNSLGDIGWYTSVYFMTLSTPQFLFNKLNERYPIRWNYGVSMFTFILGSTLCGAAQNSPMLIVGRAVAGLGAAGLLVTASAYLPFLIPPAKRPLWTGLYAASMGMGSSAGPLIAGVLTQRVTWRWTFYINIPIGVVACGLFLLLAHPPKPAAPSPLGHFMRSLDLVGLAALTPSLVCLLLALQMGGNAYAWDNGRVIALLVLFAVFAAAFIVRVFWQGDKAIVPARILAQRSIIWTILYAFCSNSASVVVMYYLPIWFQGVKEDRPLQSGVNTLPQLISTVSGSFLSGVLITLFGHTGAFMAMAMALTSVGAGLLTTLNVDTVASKWIGYQIIYGIGSGMSRHAPIVCIQHVLETKDIPMGYTVITFTQFISPSIVVAVAQAVFANTLVNGLQGLALSPVDAKTVLMGGIENITRGLSGAAKRRALDVTNEAVVHAWRVCLVLCCVGSVAALAVEHHKLRARGKIS